MRALRQPRRLEQVRERCRIKRYRLRTEQADTHVLNRRGLAVRSPLDQS